MEWYYNIFDPYQVAMNFSKKILVKNINRILLKKVLHY